MALSLAVIIVPGPSVLFIVSRAVALGRLAALLTVFGNGIGLYVQTIVVAVGLGAVLERSITAYTLVRFVGALYLVWLGVQAIRHRNGQGSIDEETPKPRGSIVAEGFAVGVSNPKTLALLTAVLPQFVRTDGAPAGLQMAALGGLFVLVALVADSVWCVAAGSARDWFARSPGRLSALGATGGAVMVGLGLRLAVRGNVK